jgi:hypothetical protein
MISGIRKAALAATFLAGSAVFAYAPTSSTMGTGGSAAGSGSGTGSSSTMGIGGSMAGNGSTSTTMGTGESSAGAPNIAAQPDDHGKHNGKKDR